VSFDSAAGDMSDDLYSEIQSHDTDRLLQSTRHGSKARHAAASTGEPISEPLF